MQHKVPYTVEANGAVYFRIKKNVYNFYIIILEMIIQLRNHILKAKPSIMLCMHAVTNWKLINSLQSAFN